MYASRCANTYLGKGNVAKNFDAAIVLVVASDVITAASIVVFCTGRIRPVRRYANPAHPRVTVDLRHKVHQRAQRRRREARLCCVL